jgi:hypothetical protein
MLLMMSVSAETSVKALIYRSGRTARVRIRAQESRERPLLKRPDSEELVIFDVLNLNTGRQQLPGWNASPNDLTSEEKRGEPGKDTDLAIIAYFLPQ